MATVRVHGASVLFGGLAIVFLAVSVLLSSHTYTGYVVLDIFNTSANLYALIFFIGGLICAYASLRVFQSI